MEPKGSLPCSQKPITGQYPEIIKSNPRPISLKFLLILSSQVRLEHARSVFNFEFFMDTYLQMLSSPAHLPVTASHHTYTHH
jgi:hypothetical protein